MTVTSCTFFVECLSVSLNPLTTFWKILFYFKLCIWMCLGVAVCSCECRCLRRPEEVIESLGAGVTGSWEQPNVDCGNWAPVLSPLKSSKSFSSLSSLSSPICGILSRGLMVTAQLWPPLPCGSWQRSPAFAMWLYLLYHLSNATRWGELNWHIVPCQWAFSLIAYVGQKWKPLSSSPLLCSSEGVDYCCLLRTMASLSEETWSRMQEKQLFGGLAACSHIQLFTCAMINDVICLGS